jgi:hypothetical protein
MLPVNNTGKKSENTKSCPDSTCQYAGWCYNVIRKNCEVPSKNLIYALTAFPPSCQGVFLPLRLNFWLALPVLGRINI